MTNNEGKLAPLNVMTEGREMFGTMMCKHLNNLFVDIYEEGVDRFDLSLPAMLGAYSFYAVSFFKDFLSMANPSLMNSEGVEFFTAAYLNGVAALHSDESGYLLRLDEKDRDYFSKALEKIKRKLNEKK